MIFVAHYEGDPFGALEVVHTLHKDGETVEVNEAGCLTVRDKNGEGIAVYGKRAWVKAGRDADSAIEAKP